jgi:hypothetical protein
MTNGYQLEGESQAVRITPAGSDQPPIFIVEVEEPFQFNPRRPEPAVPTTRRTLIPHRRT